MPNQTRYKQKFLLTSFLLLIILSCINLEALSSLRDYPNTRIPENTIETLETEKPHGEQPTLESLETEEPPVEEPSQEYDPRFPVIWDDDGSPDGMIALMYLLNNPEVEVKALTVTSGEAYPREFALLLERMLHKLNRTDIPVGAGSETPLSGDNAFPDPWRVATSEFWGIELPELPDQAEPRDAAELIIDVLNASAEPVTIFISGTHTNLAQALRIEPKIKYKIASVEVMGGALFVPGNIASDWPEGTNKTAEWNIYVDPVAAAEVFSAGLPMAITPLDATNQVIWTRQDVESWQDSAVPEGVMASQFLDFMLNAWYQEGVYAWDLVAAVNMTHQEFCESESLYVEVNTEKGPNEGRTVVIEGVIPNLSACLLPDSEVIRNHIAEVFRRK